MPPKVWIEDEIQGPDRANAAAERYYLENRPPDVFTNFMFDGRIKNLRPGFRVDDRAGNWSLYALLVMIGVGAVSGAFKHGDNFADKANARPALLAKPNVATKLLWERRSITTVQTTPQQAERAEEGCSNDLASLHWAPDSQSAPCLASPFLCQDPPSKKKV